MNHGSDVPAYWKVLAEKIHNDRDSVIVLGGPDTGKTTLINYLFQELNNIKCATAIIDADIGQSFYGLPTTINLIKPSPLNSSGVKIEKSYFVGSTSPLGHLLQMVVGLKKLIDKSHDSDVTLIDTTGFITGGAAWELKYHKIEVAAPRHIVAIQQTDEIEHFLRPQETRGIATIHRFPVHYRVRPKSQEQRRAYRNAKYRAYFKGSKRFTFSLESVSIINPYKGTDESLQGLLIGLNNNENYLLSLGIIEGVDIKRKEITCTTPTVDLENTKTMRLGSVRLDSAYADYKVKF